ncbi:hypothetical protein BH23CHL8_BH23CHL8_14390 [soil metagenome]
MTQHLLRPLAAALLLGIALLLGAAAVTAQSEETIIIGDRLLPAQLEVEPGTVVTWRNDDGARHRVRSREGPLEFDSGNLEPGEAYIFTFMVEGEYPYLDERDDDDPAYFGTVVVRSAGGPAGPLPTSPSVILFDEAFHPPEIQVAAGTTVEWLNQDGDDRHTVTSTEGLFDSGVLEGGATFSQSFESSGTFAYFCAFHPEMVGSVTVSGPDGEPADEPTPSDPVAVAGEDVSIADLAFQPQHLAVAVGTTVAWSNDDAFDHTVTSTDGAFDSGVMASGETFSWTFESPGLFEYLCAIHPSMQGSVTVGDPLAEEATAAPAEVVDPPVDGLPPTEVDVVLIDRAFLPPTMEISAGATVTWTNDDPEGHTVTALDGAFDSGFMAAGATFSHTFDSPGLYDYFCAIHPDMQGSVIALSGRLPADSG